MAVINFDATKVAPDEGRGDPIPAAWYNLAPTELNLQPTKDGQGTKISAVFQVLDGIYKGRKVYHNFNMKNQSEKAQDIGNKQFSALCHACRTLQVERTEQLLNIPFKGRVKVEAATMGPDGITVQYEAKNVITAFKDVNDAAAGTPSGATAAPVARPAAPLPAAVVFPATQGWAPATQGQNAPPVQTAAVQPQAAPQWNPPAGQQPWQPAQDPNVQPTAPSAVTSGAPVGQVQTVQIEAAPVQGAGTAGQVVPPWMQQPTA